MAGKSKLKEVELNIEDIEEKEQEHRRKIFVRVVRIGIAIAVVCGVWVLWSAIRHYDFYETRNSFERSGNESTKFCSYKGNIIEYGCDGISYMDETGEQIWNQSFEMSSPCVDICQDYMAIYDKGGMQIYIMTKEGKAAQIETMMPIQAASVASQGTIGVLMKEESVSTIALYDLKGKLLAEGKYYAEEGVFPIAIALSDDAEKLAINLAGIKEGELGSCITICDFGENGQNKIDNVTASFDYAGVLIPEIDFVSADTLVALGDDRILIFQGKNKLEVKEEIIFDHPITSVFRNLEYIGVVYGNEDEDNTSHIQVYSLNGRVVMENDTKLVYDRVEFLDNNEICFMNDNECEIFTIHSIQKFSYTFDKEIKQIIKGSGSANYIFIFNETIEEVRLK